jgi:hypothetical protein
MIDYNSEECTPTLLQTKKAINFANLSWGENIEISEEKILQLEATYFKKTSGICENPLFNYIKFGGNFLLENMELVLIYLNHEQKFLLEVQLHWNSKSLFQKLYPVIINKYGKYDKIGNNRYEWLSYARLNMVLEENLLVYKDPNTDNGDKQLFDIHLGFL